MKRLKSFLKILWSHVWPTAEPFKDVEYPRPNRPNVPNYLKTSEEYYGIPIEKEVSPLMKELLEKGHEIQKQWFRLQCLIDSAYPLSGDVSEQSIILPMMDVIPESKEEWDKVMAIGWKNTPFRVRFTPLGKYWREPMFSDPSHVHTPMNTDLNLTKDYIRRGAFSAPHPYPSEFMNKQEQQEEIRKAINDLFDFGEVTLDKIKDDHGNVIGIKVVNDKQITE